MISANRGESISRGAALDVVEVLQLPDVRNKVDDLKALLEESLEHPGGIEITAVSEDDFLLRHNALRGFRRQ